MQKPLFNGSFRKYWDPEAVRFESAPVPLGEPLFADRQNGQLYQRGRSIVQWPERAALTVALIVAVAMFAIWALLVTALGSLTDPRLNADSVLWFVEAEAVSVPPFWLVLRLIHFLIRSFTRQKSTATQKINSKKIPPYSTISDQSPSFFK